LLSIRLFTIIIGKQFVPLIDCALQCAGRRGASRTGVQVGQVCKPDRCASRTGVQVGEVCKPERCASRRGVQAGQGPGRVCKPERCPGQSRTHCCVPIRKLIDKECVTIRVVESKRSISFRDRQGAEFGVTKKAANKCIVHIRDRVRIGASTARKERLPLR